MINLLEKKHEESQTLIKIRRLAKVFTSLVLTSYIVGAAGFLGFSIFQARRSATVSAELTQLTKQEADLGVQEMLVRKVDSKATDVIDLISRKPRIDKYFEIIDKMGLKPVGWQFDAATGVQSVKLDASSSAEINNAVNNFSTNYNQVKLDQIAYTKATGWMGLIVLGGLK